MELKQLECFYALTQALNFTRAAESLYISQSSMSYQISLLEAELSTELFVRNQRHVSLTPAGAAMLPLVIEILSASSKIPAVIKQAANEYEPSTLSVALDSTEDHFELTGITDRIAEFMVKYPGTALELIHKSPTECIDGLLNHELDIAYLKLRYRENLPANLNHVTVHRDQLLLIVKEDPNIHDCKEAMEKYPPVAVTEHPRGLSRMMHFCEKLGLPAQSISVDSIPASFAYVKAGKGSMVLPGIYYYNHPYSESGLTAFELNDNSAKIRHVLAWNEFNPNPGIQKMINLF